MTEEEIFKELLQHIRAATDLAVKVREVRGVPIDTLNSSSEMKEVSHAFNRLTANLLYAGMPLLAGNEIRIRIANAIYTVLAQV